MAGGFKLSRTQSQGDVTGKQFSYHVDSAHASILAPGDAMRITGTAFTEGTPEIDATAAGTTDVGQSLTGILFSVDPTFEGEALSDTGLPATTAGTVKVNVDPHALYEVDVTNGPLLVTQVGLNANLIADAATKTGGLSISNMTLDNGSVTAPATTQTLPFRIVALSEDEDGVLGNVALVRINNSTLSDGAAGV